MKDFSAALKDEWRQLQRQHVILFSLLALGVLLLLAAANGGALTAQRMAVAAAVSAESATLRDALAEQAARGVATATAPGTVGYSLLSAPAVLSPAPLAALAVGQSDLLPAYYAVTARGEHQFMTATVLDNPLRLTLGSFDVAFVLVWLLPLVVIALAFDVVSGDRERGVLPIALAQGVTLRRFVVAKCLARAAILLAPLVLLLLLAAWLGASMAGSSIGDARALLSLALWSAAIVLYAAAWFALALFVNTVPRSSDQNAAILAGTWLLFVVVMPSLTNLIATTLFPAPSRVTLTTELREATEAADQAAAAAREAYFFDHPEMQGAEIDQIAYFQSVAESEQRIGAAMRPLLEQFDAQALAQRRVVSAMQYLSPGTTVYQLLTQLAGTDGGRNAAFRRQAQDFQRTWAEYFRSRLLAEQSLTARDYQLLPGFRFVDSPVGKLALQALWPLLALALLTVLLWVWALRRLRSFTVI